MSTLLQPVRQLARGRRLAGTLQPRHQHHRWRLRRKLQLGGVFAQDVDQFVAHDLDDLFGGRQRRHHFLANRLLADVVDQLFDHFEIDVGFQQRHADFFQRFADVLFRQCALSAQVLKGALQFVCQVLKHCQESKSGWMGMVFRASMLSLRISRKNSQSSRLKVCD